MAAYSTPSSVLETLADTFPIGTRVVTFGVQAEVVGWFTTAITREYTGDLILANPKIGRWVADPNKCRVTP